MIDVGRCAEGVRAAEPAWVARAITLAESRRREHRAAFRRVCDLLGPPPGGVIRVGVTGVPGAGKSTFIDALGVHLTGTGHRVAVLALDPSSERTGGSVLGDRTRMTRLAADPAAYVRPSPSGGTLGGVARSTRDAMTVVEAAGYDVVLVETVGVGQSETAVAGLVDSVLLLGLTGAGDELQGIKRGLLELADVVAVNKADGANAGAARRAARELAGALALLRSGDAWRPPVLTCSSREDTGIAEVWAEVRRHRDTAAASGELADRRRRQRVAAMWSVIHAELLDRLRADPRVQAALAELADDVAAGVVSPATAASHILGLSRF